MFFFNGYIKGRWRRRKSPLNWALSVVCSTPPGNSRQQNRGDLLYKNDCASILCWRINCEVVPLTVLKHSQLFKKLLCEKHVWLNFHTTSSTYSFRLPKKYILCRRNMKKKYMISCGSTSWVGRIRWQWKYRRHCVIDIPLFFPIPASLLFSLCSPLAQFSAHLNAWNRPVLTMKILHWVIGATKAACRLFLVSGTLLIV